MKKKLKSLEESNAQNSAVQWAYMDNSPVPNGIACPTCGEELVDSQSNVILTSMPAQKNVHCNKCGYVGYRIA